MFFIREASNLDDNFIRIKSLRFPLYIAFNIAVTHFDWEFYLIIYIHNTTIWIIFCIDFPIEEFVSPDSGNHVRSSAIYSYIVASTQLKSSNHIINHKERFLNLGQSCGSVMWQSANSFTSITIVKGMTSIGSR